MFEQPVEMSRSWSSAHDWKSCRGQKLLESSNLSISAKNPVTITVTGFSFFAVGIKRRGRKVCFATTWKERSESIFSR